MKAKEIEESVSFETGIMYAATFVLDCYIADYPSSKQHPVLSSQLCRSGVWTWCDWVHCLGSHQDGFKVSAGSMFISGSTGEKSTPQLTPVGSRIQSLAV